MVVELEDVAINEIRSGGSHRNYRSDGRKPYHTRKYMLIDFHRIVEMA